MGSCSNCASDRKEMPKPWKNPQVIYSVFSGILLGFGFLLGRFDLSVFSKSFYFFSVISGGYFFAREAFEDLIKEREIGIELLMTVAALTAAALGELGEAGTLVFLYSISEALEGYTGQRARSAIRLLMDLSPKRALVKRDGKEILIPVESLKVGDIFIVKPGESIPTDGIVIDGHSSVNQAPITGESVPVEKTKNDVVFAATINEEGALFVRVTKVYKENTFSRIIELIEKAQASKGQSQRFIEKIGKRYSPAVLLVGILVAIVPPLLGHEWADWLSRATVFIVAAAPCALVISIPITLVAALGTAGRKGILIKGGIHLENLSKINVIAFDKTGTLTVGKPVVQDIFPLNNFSENNILQIASALEVRSQHPIARAILEKLKERKLDSFEVSQFKSHTGLGVSGTINGQKYFVGNPKFFSELNLAKQIPKGQVNRLQSEGKTVVLISSEKDIMGLISVSDPIKKEAQVAIKKLKTLGIKKIIMLTGDNELTAQTVGTEVGVDEVYSELSPEGKTRHIQQLEKKYGHVVMIGDGVNDAPALTASHVGVAMGVAGTDAALETADIVLMGDDLSKIPYLIEFGKRNWSIIMQNLILSIIVITTLVLGAIGGVFNLTIAVLAHEVSELLVIASGLRMLRSKEGVI